MNFCVAILILKMEEKQQFLAYYYIKAYNNKHNIMLYYIKKGKMQLKHKNRSVQCTEKVLWLTKRVRSGLCSSVLEIFRWTMLHSQAYKLKLTATKSRH